MINGFFNRISDDPDLWSLQDSKYEESKLSLGEEHGYICRMGLGA